MEKMEGILIKMVVSLRDCRKFQEFIKDCKLAEGFDLKMIQESTNTWFLSSEEYIPSYEVLEIINELEQECEGYEVEFIPEY